MPQVPRNRESFEKNMNLQLLGVSKFLVVNKEYELFLFLMQIDLLENHHFSVAREHISRHEPLMKRAKFINILSFKFIFLSKIKFG